MYKKGTGNDKQGKEAGNRTFCPNRNFSQAIRPFNGGFPPLNQAANTCCSGHNKEKLSTNIRNEYTSRNRIFSKEISQAILATMVLAPNFYCENFLQVISAMRKSSPAKSVYYPSTQSC